MIPDRLIVALPVAPASMVKSLPTMSLLSLDCVTLSMIAMLLTEVIVVPESSLKSIPASTEMKVPESRVEAT